MKSFSLSQLPPLPNVFEEVLSALSSPDMFNVALSEKERREIFEKISSDRKYGCPRNFLEWRDAVYDAMIDLGYELA